MKKISATASWKAGWGVFKKNWLILLYVLLVPMAVSLFLSTISDFGIVTKKEAVGLAFLWSAVFLSVKYLISTLFNLGSLKIQLKATNDIKPKYRDLINGFDIYWDFLLMSILYALVVLGGLILLIIPGIYFAITYMFAPFLIVDKQLSVSEAFAKSKQMTKGKVWQIFKFIFVSAIFTLSGLIALIVGVVITSMMSGLALIQLYKQLLNESTIATETLNLGLEEVENLENSNESAEKSEVSTEKTEAVAEKPVENANN